jgi:DNA-binding NtrC family response regulator
MMPARRVMIVEDEPNVRLVFRTALEADHYTLIVAEDGETALRGIAHDPPDVVLLDLRMPGIGGMEVLRRLRAEGSDVPVLVITAFDNVPNAVEAMRLGAIDFLPKPIAPVLLRRVVAEVLARHDRDETESAAPGPRDTLQSAKRALNHRLFYRAEGLLREAIEERPESAEPWYLLGVLYEVQHKPKAAREAYEAALEVDPNHEAAKLHLLKFRFES